MLPLTMGAPSETFLIAEYEALRREIEVEIRELGEFLRYGLLASGGIWAWLLSQQKIHVAHVAYYLPAAVTAFLYIETSLVRRSIYKVGSYLVTLERHFNLPAGLGWERHLSTTRRKGHWLARWEHFIWMLVFAANFIFAIYASRMYG